MAKNLMIQGTMSGAGKSILTAGILRVLHQDGYRVAPFKSQNMALNSYVTRDGKEIGRAQALQAFAAGMEPDSDMNPILLKPTGETASQVIVNGLPVGDMRAADYFRKKKDYIPEVLSAYERLSSRANVVVIEGAGSPVEINLRENDIVNMGLAKMLDAPVLLAGNIDPGGVFAQLLGTVQLLGSEERERVKGLIINKFRGDKKLLDPGLSMFRDYCDIPFVGVVPYAEFELEEEDSLSDKLKVSGGFSGSGAGRDVIRIAVIR
ncbi:MAG: cobyric acid synthase, partial [Butyrivibrio sp.]|nr:cobyric acid synthase [Butyrivibrio sp.]